MAQLAASSRKGDSGRPVRVLVVDDDPTMREMVVKYLEDHDIIAVGASGRQEMASHLAGGDLSLVLLRLRLGQGNGLDLLRDTRARSEVPGILPGDRRQEIYRADGPGLGAPPYLPTPFRPHPLLARPTSAL